MLGMILSGCGGKSDEGSIAADAARDSGSSECPADVPPKTLECTGLYSDIERKKISAGVHAYAPAVPLWSDGAQKRRWIYLPPGKRIDAADPNEWRFPVGTKVWKEFSWAGKRVETRLFYKVASNQWVHATYAWNGDESAASISGGGDIPAPDGGTYHIPTHEECDECHRGRTDHLLGFEAVSLGLPGATGQTLKALVDQDQIAPAPASTSLEIGDDGTGWAAKAMGWLHINCGTTCHNGNPNASAVGAGMRLRLDPTLLDGRSSVAFDPRSTTLDVPANAPAWNGRLRIAPGDPNASLLVALISNRGEGNQMPPIASRIVDGADVENVVTWIRRMPTTAPKRDAGNDGSSGTLDAGHRQGPPDASVSDAAPGARDASVDAAAASGDASTKDADAAFPDVSAIPGLDSGGDARAVVAHAAR